MFSSTTFIMYRQVVAISATQERSSRCGGDRDSRYVTFQMVEVAIPRNLFAMILARIARLRLLPG